MIHLTTLTIPIQNQKCLKNAKKKRIRGQHIFHICVFYSEQGNLHTETAAFFFIIFRMERKYSVINIAPFGIDHILCPANPEFGLPMNAFVKTTKSRLHFKWQGENCCPRMPFFAFLRHFYSEWVLLKWLNESGSKF